MGDLKVLKLSGAVDCGLAVNPNGVRAQMEGGACDALRTALAEEITIDGGPLERGSDVRTAIPVPELPPGAAAFTEGFARGEFDAFVH
ncbi:MAG TPA: molybdopterin cofactor-binding domain-containing protein [Woeseiaceae bacterium]|nr:molybdopterin cofactor-binding domain-containing protein [Woeseiaceae bacterium]